MTARSPSPRSGVKNLLGISVVATCLLLVSGCTSKQSYVDRGNRLLEAGKYADASIQYRKAIQKDPQFGEAHYRLGLVSDGLYDWYFNTKRMAEAENLLKTKVNNNPKEADYILQLALHYNRLQKAAEMNSTLKEILDNPKDFPKGRLQVGDFYMKGRYFPEAIRCYEELARVNPQDRVISQKRITGALLAQGKKEEAFALVEQILKQQPKDDEVRRLRAGLWLEGGKTGNVDKALPELQALSARHPGDASLWFEMGRANQMKGDLETARKQFQEAVNRRKDFVQARYELAALDLNQHRASEALQQSADILSMHPNDPRARLLRAVALIRTGNSVLARSELTQLTKEFPQYSEPRLQLGLLDLSEKKYQEARETFGKISVNDPRRMAAMAATSSSERQFAKAIDLLNDALKQSPDSFMLREQLANTAVAAGQYDLAMAEFRKLLTSAPQSVVLRVSLARVYELKGDHDSSIGLYREAQALSPTNPVPTLSLAGALMQAGRTDEAKAEYQKLLK